MSHLSMLVPVRSIGHSEVVPSAHRIGWSSTASEEGILISDAITLLRSGDAIKRLAEIGPATKTEVADRLQASHDTTPRSKIDDAAEVAVSIGEEILGLTEKYAPTQGSPGYFDGVRYTCFSTQEGIDAVQKVKARYPAVYPAGLNALVHRAEMWWRRG